MEGLGRWNSKGVSKGAETTADSCIDRRLSHDTISLSRSSQTGSRKWQYHEGYITC